MGTVWGKKKKEEVGKSCSLTAVKPSVKDEESPTTIPKEMDRHPPPENVAETETTQDKAKDGENQANPEDQPITGPRKEPKVLLSQGAQLQPSEVQPTEAKVNDAGNKETNPQGQEMDHHPPPENVAETETTQDKANDGENQANPEDQPITGPLKEPKVLLSQGAQLQPSEVQPTEAKVNDAGNKKTNPKGQEMDHHPPPENVAETETTQDKANDGENQANPEDQPITGPLKEPKVLLSQGAQLQPSEVQPTEAKVNDAGNKETNPQGQEMDHHPPPENVAETETTQDKAKDEENQANPEDQPITGPRKEPKVLLSQGAQLQPSEVQPTEAKVNDAGNKETNPQGQEMDHHPPPENVAETETTQDKANDGENQANPEDQPITGPLKEPKVLLSQGAQLQPSEVQPTEAKVNDAGNKETNPQGQEMDHHPPPENVAETETTQDKANDGENQANPEDQPLTGPLKEPKVLLSQGAQLQLNEVQPTEAKVNDAGNKETNPQGQEMDHHPPPENVAETETTQDKANDGENQANPEDQPITGPPKEPKVLLSQGAQLQPSEVQPTEAKVNDARNNKTNPQGQDKEKDLQAITEQCWQEIERQCSEHVGKNYASSGMAFSGWRVVRLFVSSTFQDFQNEREVLVKKVFPELREWCESRHLHLIECDLRWGVPKDSTTRTVLTSCMEEIDRCHGDADGEGFFLNMLGERYGWVPSRDDVPNDIAEEYKWVPFTSVTHMEILLGAYRSLNPNAAFFLRDSSGFAKMIPVENKRQFVEPTELGKVQLKELRAKVQERFPEQSFTYSCEFDAVEDSRVILKGLDDFGRQVLEFFKTAIEKKYPDSDSIAPTPDKLEQDRHDIYMEQKGQLVFGRDTEISKMVNFAKGVSEGADEGVNKKRHHQRRRQGGARGGVRPPMKSRRPPRRPPTRDHHYVHVYVTSSRLAPPRQHKAPRSPPCAQNPGDAAGHHLVVVADPGEGKSSLMARFVMEAKKAGLNVFYHFVGCTAESNTPSSILKRLVNKLEELYPNVCTCSSEKEGKTPKKKTEDKVNAEKMAAYMKNLRQTDNQLLIAVDAVNQTSKERDRYRWLPKSLSGNLRCVMSTTRKDGTLKELREHCPEAAELTLTALDDEARVEIVTNYFRRYNKTLDPEQLTLLTHLEGAKNALWLSLSCEELRVYGVFEKLTDRIREIPDSLEGLIEIILTRLIREDESGMVEKMLHFLQCVVGGLNETELQALLGDIDSGTPAAALHWATVRRTMKPFLRNSGAHGEVERLQFFHLAINKAVEKRLTEEPDTKKLRHRQLADYYQYHCSDYAAVVNQLAHQLSQAREGQRLVDFFRKDKRSSGVNRVERSRYLKEFRCTYMTPSSFPGCTKFGYCVSCMNARTELDPNSCWQNKDCCAICGDRMPFPGLKYAKAYWCPFHQPEFPSFGAIICYVCQKPIIQSMEPPLAYLCNFCDPGFMEQCCKLVP